MINNIRKRIKEVSNLIEKYPEVKEFYIERAKLYDEIKDYKKAVSDFRKAYCGYYAPENIITVCEKIGFKKEAERLYTKAINENKNNVHKYTDRLYFYMRIGEFEKAILDCKNILELSPDDKTILTLKKILTR